MFTKFNYGSVGYIKTSTLEQVKIMKGINKIHLWVWGGVKRNEVHIWIIINGKACTCTKVESGLFVKLSSGGLKRQTDVDTDDNTPSASKPGGNYKCIYTCTKVESGLFVMLGSGGL